ncbi:hypothetical protein K491DRAFT_613095 [Lophiostoma macrostomum CBS 122681]|uniref:Nucleotide exchange factor Fes1 domain-containing protein n=1 Tax=Lophiostoma macrostomum CBS 122681 TaxID=1314788 RepID=A0A6A6SKM5_9PLEO|nr:hypothetical protein K491DRAFT_613095 [Lophiostoma macrostomum CBS 122681]
MNDPTLNDVFKWSIQNSGAANQTGDLPPALPNAAGLGALFGMPVKSETQQVEENFAIIQDPKSSTDDIVDAFENLELLVSKIDTANNLEAMKKWTVLMELLDHERHEMRLGAADCVGTAVENNPRAQERMLVLGAIPKLVKLATQDENRGVRKKAIRALSCGSRNYQPNLDATIANLPGEFKPKDKLDAGDMDSVDSLIEPLRANAQRAT